jgi:hypothetical protein
VILTLCISVLALAVSMGVLIWQIVSWRRSGPRVRVIWFQGTYSPPWAKKSRSAAGAVGFIEVRAENFGRLGTEVQAFGFQLPDGQFIHASSDYKGVPVELPKALPPGGLVSVRYDVPSLWMALANDLISGKGVRPFVATGHGRVVGKPFDLGEIKQRLGPS